MMKNGIPSLKFRHTVFLVMVAFLSQHFMLAAQRPDRRSDKSHFPQRSCVVTPPRPSVSTSALMAVPPSCGELLEGPQFPNEGVTNYSLYVRPKGRVESVMLFVDFPDAPGGSEKTSDLYNSFVPNSETWYATASNNQLSIAVTEVPQWYGMPQNSYDYKLNERDVPADVYRARHEAYIKDAIGKADKDVDFTKYKTVYIVASKGAKFNSAFTLPFYPGQGVKVDGGEICSAVIFGADIRDSSTTSSSYAFVHETGHTFGLADLYAFDFCVYDYQFKYLGAWSVMSWDLKGTMFNAWDLRKLGWLDPSQMRCLGVGRHEETITALEEVGGLKALVIRTSPYSAYVIEVRQKINLDSYLCDRGVLVYKVDARVESGSGPIVVEPARACKDAGQNYKCGLLYNATLNLDQGGEKTLDVVNGNFKVEVLSEVGTGYKVRVTRRR